MANQKQTSRACAIAVAGAAGLFAFPGVANAAVTSTVSGGVLTATGDANADTIAITCVGGNVKVNSANPAPTTACSAITSIIVSGEGGADTIDLSAVSAALFPNLASTSLDGGDADDDVIGSERNDTIIWNPGDDNDDNDGRAGTDTIQVNGGGGPEQFTAKPSVTAGFTVRFDRVTPAPFDIEIVRAERLDMNANGGDDSFIADGALNALNFALDIDGGEGNDSLDGGDGADLITGGEGNDRITGDDNPVGTRDNSVGGDGDDTMVWNPGDDDDTNEGGAGSDTIEVNGGGTEQFTVKPSTTAGRVLFDRTGPSPTPGPFNLDIGTSERLDMNAGAGEDTFTADAGLHALNFTLDVDGGDGNDVLDGGDGADVIAGGAGDDRIIPDDNPAGTRDDARGGDGDDTIVWNGGDDDDLNEGGAGNDVSEVNGAAADEIFTIKPSPTAGRVLFDRLATPGPGPFSVDIGTTETLHLLANAGNDRIRGARGVDGRIRTILDAGDGNDRIRGTDAIDAIRAGKGNDIVNSIDRAEDTVSCDQGFDLAFVDRRDFLRQCDVVIGGLLRVRMVGGVEVDGNTAVLRLRCVASKRCKSNVKLRRAGKTLGKEKVKLSRGETETVRVELNARGRRLLAGASNGLRVKLQVDSRDKKGNGWRTTKKIRLQP